MICLLSPRLHARCKNTVDSSNGLLSSSFHIISASLPFAKKQNADHFVKQYIKKSYKKQQQKRYFPSFSLSVGILSQMGKLFRPRA